MYCWCHRTKQVLSCKSCHTFWLLNHCFGAIFHWLYFMNILWILGFYSAFFYILYHQIVAFSLIFHYFVVVVVVVVFYYHHFFFNCLIAPPPSSCFLLSMILHFFNFLLALPPHPCFFFDFHLFFVVSGFYFFSWKFLAAFCYFLLQCNFILNYFWLTSSGGCPNYTFWRLIPQGTHNQGGQAHLAKMHLLTKSSIWHCSFQISSHLLVKKDISSF